MPRAGYWGEKKFILVQTQLGEECYTEFPCVKALIYMLSQALWLVHVYHDDDNNKTE